MTFWFSLLTTRICVIIDSHHFSLRAQRFILSLLIWITWCHVWCRLMLLLLFYIIIIFIIISTTAAPQQICITARILTILLLDYSHDLGLRVIGFQLEILLLLLLFLMLFKAWLLIQLKWRCCALWVLISLCRGLFLRLLLNPEQVILESAPTRLFFHEPCLCILVIVGQFPRLEVGRSRKIGQHVAVDGTPNTLLLLGGYGLPGAWRLGVL